jgi:hypothetical protein
MTPGQTCTWTEDQDDGNWWTSCQQTFEFYDGTPTDNRFAYCPYCGDRIIEVRAALAGKEDKP